MLLQDFHHRFINVLTVTVTLACLITLPAQQAFAWGYIGHATVGEIATKNLSKKARGKLRAIMGRESLATSANWPDEIRSDAAKRISIGKRWPTEKFKDNLDAKDLQGLVNQWHYTTVTNDLQKYDESKKAKGGDIVSALQLFASVIKDPKRSKQDKKDAIRLVAHFTGDIHQPLHVGNGLDRGGNNCWVNWFAEKYPKNIKPFPGKENNYQKLHRVWDDVLIESRKLSYTEYADRLMRDEDLKKPKLGKGSIKALVEGWANESRALREKVYPGKPNEKGLYPYCFHSFTDSVDEKKIPHLGWDERYEMLKIADRRLFEAGHRLAQLLDRVL